MSHKQAKSLRKAMGISGADMRTRHYNDNVMRTVMVDTGRIDGKGNDIMRPEVRTMRENTGLRKAYQLIKRKG